MYVWFLNKTEKNTDIYRKIYQVVVISVQFCGKPPFIILIQTQWSPEFPLRTAEYPSRSNHLR